MDADAIERLSARLAEGTRGRADAALEHARSQVEALATTAAELEATLPTRLGEAVREGFRAEALPVGRQLAEVRGLAAQTIHRLEQLEDELRTERDARVEDLGLLVDLIAAGWRSVDERLDRITATLRAQEATVHQLDERRA